LRVCVLTIVGVLLFGYLSNILAYPKAADLTKSHLLSVVQRERPAIGKSITWVDEANVRRITDPYLEEIKNIRFLGVQIPQPWFHPDKEYMPQPYPRDYPWAYVKVRQWDLPFVVFVYHGWEAAALWGRGGVTIFLCILGYPVEIHDYNIWVT